MFELASSDSDGLVGLSGYFPKVKKEGAIFQRFLNERSFLNTE
jgi:hypothetical protein